jgi:hypothetical protein
MCQGFSALALNDLNGFLGGRQVNVSTKYQRAFACKRDRRCLAVTPAGANRSGADNKDYLAFEPISDLGAPIGPRQAPATKAYHINRDGLLCTKQRS